MKKTGNEKKSARLVQPLQAGYVREYPRGTTVPHGVLGSKDWGGGSEKERPLGAAAPSGVSALVTFVHIVDS